MNTEKQKTVPLEVVLTELTLSQDTPDAALLDEYTRRFPEYAEALTSYAIELAVEAAVERGSPVIQPAETSALAMRAMSRFQNRKFEVGAKKQPAPAKSATPANPLASLPTNHLRAAIGQLHINDVFMMKLRDRRIREDTIPMWFRTELARELSVSDDVLRAHLAAPPQIHGATSFKADQKPRVVAKETFEEAIERSGLTPEQQAALRRT